MKNSAPINNLSIMKTKSFISQLIISSCLLYSVNSIAVVISNSAFIKNGGNPSNIHTTIEDAYEPLRKQSFAFQFDAVGKIYGCTATWLGDSNDGRTSYILTAAHCAEYNDPSASTGRYTGQFRDRHDRLIAEDGVYYLGPYRVNRPAGFGGASTDIAILALNKKANMQDDRGNMLSPPWLYDGNAEKGKAVSLVGYGDWGTGHVSPKNNSSDESFTPEAGSRRAWGESYIDDIWEMDHGMSAPYHPEKTSAAWARLSPGDSGSAWWQNHHGFWVITGTTNGGAEYSSNAARVSKYIGWIKTIYPEARTLKEMTTINAEEARLLPDLSQAVSEGAVAYTLPPQTSAIGPTATDWDLGQGYSEIQLNLREVNSAEYHQVALRAWRDVGCAKAPMNSAVSCGNGKSTLVLKYYPEDNKNLPAGRYKGEFYIQAQGWHDTQYKNTLMLNADINVEEETINHYSFYKEGYRYSRGERVTTNSGESYQCLNTRLCSGNTRLYAPGSGSSWTKAWKRLN